MNERETSTLTWSSTSGRYALDSPYGTDLTSSEMYEVELGGQWVAGSIEHAPVYSVDALPHQHVYGYTFVAWDGHIICGLCVGMRVRPMGEEASHAYDKRGL